MLIIDSHLDIAYNALTWDRDLTQSIRRMRESEAGMPEKGRGLNVVSFEALRRGEIGLFFVTMCCRVASHGKRFPGVRTQDIAYAKDRVQFGSPISNHQAIQFKLATMATELEAARMLTYAAAAAEHRRRGGRLASEAKLYASEAANRACFESLQIHGGNGFSDEYEISRLYRDVRVTTIYEGTSEMQRWVISRHLLI